MQLKDIRALCRKRLGDANGTFWTDPELDTLINDGARDIAYRTKCLKSNGYLDTVSCVESTASEGTRIWTLSSEFPGFYAVEEAYFNIDGKEWDKMTPTTRDDLNNERPGWKGTVGYTVTTGTADVYNVDSVPAVPNLYWWDREEDEFGIHPPPDADSAGSNYVHVYYTKEHANISGEDTEPTIPEPLHLAIVSYVAATGYEDRGWGDRANDQWNKYFSKIKDYEIETGRERSDEEIISKNYKNI